MIKFSVGDLIEVIHNQSVELSGDIGIGARGCIVEYLGQDTFRWRGNCEYHLKGHWYRCILNGQECCAGQSALRKIPGDERKIVEWDWRTLLQPERVTIHAD